MATSFNFDRILDTRSDADSPITEDLFQDVVSNSFHNNALVRSDGTLIYTGAIDSNPSNTSSSRVVDAGPTGGAIGNVKTNMIYEVTSGNAKGTMAAINQIGAGSSRVTISTNLFSAGMRIGDTYRVIYGTVAGLAHTHDGVDSFIIGNAPTITVFTANGTWTKPAGLKSVQVVVVGGGGGSGGTGSTGNNGSDRATAGGAGGGTSIKRILAASLGATETVTVGAGGTAGNDGEVGVGNGSSGGPGGTSSFGAHVSATGGGGSTNNEIPPNTGPQGGIGSGGDINIRGQAGGLAVPLADGTAGTGGNGGSSYLGGGAQGAKNAAGNAGGQYGAGAGGASGNVSGSRGRAGAAGSAGIVVVFEYT